MRDSRRTFLWQTLLAASAPLWRPAAALAELGRVDVRARGAAGDGRTNDTAAIQAAVDEASASGRAASVPAGKYVVGTVHLRDHTTLVLDRDAVLIASRDDGDFDRPERHGYETFADRETSDFAFALLRGTGVKDVRIAGPGRIDGNRSSRSGPKAIALKSCTGVVIRDVAIANAGSYNISLLGCDDVDIEGVTILNGYADGIDPDGCRHVRIARCHVETRDDAVCLKASLALGARRDTENVVISECRLVTLHNAIKLGTESSGDFRDIVVRDCSILGRRHPWKGDLTSGISLEAVDGGVLERVSIQNVQMAGVRSPLFLRLARRGRGQRVPVPGALRDVSIEDVVATGALVASSVTGIRGGEAERITLRNIQVATRGDGRADRVSLRVPEKERSYPDAFMFENLPAYGLYCRHVDGLTMAGVTFAIDRPDARSAIVLDDVRDVDVQSLQATAPAHGEPTLWLSDVRDARFGDLRAPGAGPVARISGATTARVALPDDVGRRVVVDRDVDGTALALEPEQARIARPSAR